MPAPAVRRLALAAAPALLACSLAAAPVTAASPAEPVRVVQAGSGPTPVVEDPRTADELDLVPASRVLPDPGIPHVEAGQGPLVGVGLALLALVGAFVVGLSRRPDPVD